MTQTPKIVWLFYTKKGYKSIDKKVVGVYNIYGHLRD